MPEPLREIRSYLPEPLREIKTYLPDPLREIRTYLPEPLREIRAYLPEPHLSVIPPEMKNKHHERSFFLAKECKFGVKNIKILYVRDSLFFTTLIKLSVTNGI